MRLVHCPPPDFEQEIDREFISPEQMVGFIENDLRNKVARFICIWLHASTA